VLKNRNQADHIRSVSGTGQHLLGSNTTLDYRVSLAHSREEQLDRLDPILRQSRIAFTPNVSASSIDPENIQPNPSADNPANATLNAWEAEIFESNDRDVTGSSYRRRHARLPPPRVAREIRVRPLNDYIFPFRFGEAAFGDTYQVTQPRNGDSASLWGAELAFQNQLRFLPGPLDRLGVYANVTLTDSSADFPDRGTTSTLPGQSSRLGQPGPLVREGRLRGPVLVELPRQVHRRGWRLGKDRRLLRQPRAGTCRSASG
jgi:hypothetical protein